ncbi:MAG: histone deacetylase [Candidatus Acetothermia bacterium]|jgi:acetoin utilization deacetylase AcuC-like enzyme|nr:histone deacetylase [Candidatus Acetothermia bacterium]
MDIIFSERCLEYHAIGHPEGPARVRMIQHYLAHLGYPFVEAVPATQEELLAVHTLDHIRRVESRDFSDPDCPAYPDIGFYAALAVGGAILAQKRHGFSILRPPGHHAGPAFLGGFCYYNNLAVAVKLSGNRTLIVDIDGHHGNGTEAVFFGNPDVTYVSLHRMYNYPGTGHHSQGNCLNFPLPPRCGKHLYLETLEQALAAAGRNHEELAISVGFDTYKDDPLASLGLEVEAFYDIGYLLGDLRLPTFCVLEGGYVPEIMGPAAEALLTGLEEGGARTGG